MLYEVITPLKIRFNEKSSNIKPSMPTRSICKRLTINFRRWFRKANRSCMTSSLADLADSGRHRKSWETSMRF